MLGGTELIRRKLGEDAHAMTITLLTDSQGNKMGKTAGNAVWLDPNKTSPFDFYQYWRNVDDADVLKCLRMLTFLPLEQIEEMAHWEGSQLNRAKEILAFELTKLVHGEEEAAKAQEEAKKKAEEEAKNQKAQTEEAASGDASEDAKKDEKNTDETEAEDASSEEESEDLVYKNGTYTGDGQGFGGNIQVQVTLENDTITDIQVVSAPGEDSAYLSQGQGVISTILASQSTDVDTISGATFSSTGIINAVNDALGKAENQ